MSRRRAFSNEWMIWFALICVLIAAWAPIVGRFSGLSQPIVFGALTGLAIALWLLCGLIEERDFEKAARLKSVFLGVPALGLLFLLAFALWRFLT